MLEDTPGSIARPMSSLKACTPRISFPQSQPWHRREGAFVVGHVATVLRGALRDTPRNVLHSRLIQASLQCSPHFLSRFRAVVAIRPLCSEPFAEQVE